MLLPRIVATGQVLSTRKQLRLTVKPLAPPFAPPLPLPPDRRSYMLRTWQQQENHGKFVQYASLSLLFPDAGRDSPNYGKPF